MSQDSPIPSTTANQPPAETGQSAAAGAESPPTLRDIVQKHGRYYGTWKHDKYFFPIDAEETQRMDMIHQFFLELRDQRICCYDLPPNKQLKIMDLGTGTGIWAFHAAESYTRHNPGFVPNIMAVDINMIQPQLIPQGVSIKQFDIEDDNWNPLLKECDLIHMRMMAGAIESRKWPSIYKKVFEHLAPGSGYLEHVEVDWEPHWQNESRSPSQSSPQALETWFENFSRGMNQLNRNIRIAPTETRRMLEQAGFKNIKQEQFKVTLSPWGSTAHDRNTARWFNLVLTMGLQAMGMVPMIEKLGMAPKDVKNLCSRTHKEACKMSYHTYCHIYVWTAWKPDGEAEPGLGRQYIPIGRCDHEEREREQARKEREREQDGEEEADKAS